MGGLTKKGIRFDNTMVDGDVGEKLGWTLTKTTIPTVDNEIVSFSCSPTTMEIGTTLTAATYNWAMTRNSATLTSQIISGTGLVGSPVTVLPATTRSYAGTLSLTPTGITTYTYTLNTVGDDAFADSATATITSQFRWYWGASTLSNLQTQSAAYIKSVLTPGRLAGGIVGQTTTAIDCTGGKYVYWFYPAAPLWTNYTKIYIGGFEIGTGATTAYTKTNTVYTNSYTLVRLDTTQHSSDVVLTFA